MAGNIGILFNVISKNGNSAFEGKQGWMCFIDAAATTRDPDWKSCNIAGLSSSTESVTKLDEKYLPAWLLSLKPNTDN